MSELGFVSIAGMGGHVPIPYTELVAYATAHNLNLKPYQYKILYSMSKAYATQHAISIEPQCPAPYMSTEGREEEIQDKVTQQAMLFFQRTKQQQGTQKQTNKPAQNKRVITPKGRK